MLDDVEHARFKRAAPFLGAKPLRGIAKVDLAALGYHHGIGIANRRAAELIRQHGEFAIGRDREQAAHRIRRDQIARAVKVKTQHPPTSGNKTALLAAIRLHAQNCARHHRRVE